MTYISPLLQSRINNSNRVNSQNNAVHERIYEDLRRHANDVKPNDAKAKLIKEGPVTAVISGLKDTAQDGKNFFRAVKTGQLGDNNLGRLNDLGLKAGALLLATFLASQAKTKTDAIMQFVGGGTFFATMALWPKLFINLPARLVHGFNIGQRYVSAQGDKKDFFLDNQFLPWDAYSKDEMTAIGKRTGIDINSENGQEKIQRKMQKTALQNRTLWMATAGFATPLITSVVGNFVNPRVENAVIKNGYKKVSKILDVENGGKNAAQQVATRLNGAAPIFKNQKEIDKLFKEFETKPLSEDFFEKLASMLQIAPADVQKQADAQKGIVRTFTDALFKNPDDARPLKGAYGQGVARTKAALQEMFEQGKKVDTTKLEQLLKEAKDEAGTFFDASEVESMMKQFGSNPSVAQIEKEVAQAGMPKKMTKELIGKLFDANAGKEEFFQKVKDYNSTTLAEVRGRLKSFLDILNPVMGEKSESVYTKEYNEILQKLFSQFNLKYSSKDANVLTLSSLNKKETDAVVEELSKFFSGKIGEFKSDADYQNFLKGFVVEGSEFKDKDKLTEILGSLDVLKTIIPEEFKGGLTDSIFGSFKENASEMQHEATIFGSILRFKNAQQTNIKFAQIRPIIAANFEKRLKDGSIQLNGDELAAAKSIVYGGNLSNLMNNGHVDKDLFGKVVGIIFDKGAFKEESDILKDMDIAGKVGSLKQSINEELNNSSVLKSILDKKSFDLAARFKEYATKMYNNKSWAKIFIPATLVLVAVTLLAQPFFGKIKDEYPEEEKGGAK